MDESRIARRWTKCVDLLSEVRDPAYGEPVKDEWRLCSKQYIYKAFAPTSTVTILNQWAESTVLPRIVGSFFIMESVEDGEGTYAAIPMSLLKGPILVKKIVKKVYYRIGADVDAFNDPKKQHRYHIEFAEMEPEEDKNFVWYPASDT